MGIFLRAASLIAEQIHWKKSEAIEYMKKIVSEVGGKLGISEDKTYSYWIYPNTETEKGQDIILIKCVKAILEDQNESDFPIEWNIIYQCNYGDNGKLYFERNFLYNPPTIDTLNEWKEIFIKLRSLANYDSISAEEIQQEIAAKQQEAQQPAENDVEEVEQQNQEKRIPLTPSKAE